MANTDWQKIEEYNKLFQNWKNELFPNKEYMYSNECCYAFAHLLAQKAKEAGLLPLKAWCLQSEKREYPNDSPLIVHKNPQNYTVSVVRPSDNPMEFNEVGWNNYHVAMCIRSGKEIFVFDPIIFDGVATLSQWKNVLNAKEYNIEISGCSLDGSDKSIINGGSGYWRAPNPSDMNSHAKNKILQIDCEQKPEHLLRSKLLIDLQKQKRQGKILTTSKEYT